MTDKTTEQLRACPFCGNFGQPRTTRTDYTHHHVVCKISAGGCGAKGATRETRELAIAAWNTRADAVNVRDAERYRWLRVNSDECVVYNQSKDSVSVLGTYDNPDVWDSTIDAAIASREGEGT